jgi:hypothetical protein
MNRTAELINEFRIFPRVFVSAYLLFFVWAWRWVVTWFMAFDWHSLPTDPVIGATAVAAVAGFPAIILGVLSRVLMKLILSYWNGASSTAYKPKVNDAI